MVKKINGWLYWTPRVLAIVFLGFLAMFSLDIFEGNYGFWGTVVGLLMHNIPVIVLAIVLAIAWKREIVGGVVFVLAGLFYITLIWRNMMMHPGQPGTILSSLIITGPALVIGILFAINWVKKEK